MPNKLQITDGTAQKDRFPAALKEHYVDVDERSMESLLSISADFADLVSFYNLRNKRDGSWKDLFTDDDLTIIATILTTDLKTIESEFFTALEGNFDEPYAGYRLLTDRIYELAAQIDFWFKKLSGLEITAINGLSQKIERLIAENLSTALHNLGEFRKLLESDETSAALNFRKFENAWKVSADQAAGPLFAKARLPDLSNDAAIKNFLRSNYYAFRNAVTFLKKMVQGYLAESLSNQLHDPAVGLLVTFVKLFRHAQNQLNNFTERHLDFYYFDTLKIQPKAPVPDSAYLIFVPENENRAIPIKKGALFSAGLDENRQEILFAAENDLLVTDVKVNSLFTLNFDRNKLVSPEKELDYVAAIRLQNVPPAGNELLAWPIFGKAAEEGRQIRPEQGEVGFAVASPVLLLKEGTRRITLLIEYSLPEAAAPEKDGAVLIKRFREARDEKTFFQLLGELFKGCLLTGTDWLRGEQAEELLQQAEKITSPLSCSVIKQLLAYNHKDFLYKIFNNLFRIAITTEQGWHEIAEYLLIPEPGDPVGTLKIEFILNPETTAVAAYAEEVHGMRLLTRLPLLKILINQEAYLNPYSILRDIFLDKIILQTAVRGVKNLLCYNNFGQVDPSGPFQPFGPLPTDNSYLIIGNAEAARKNLTEVALNIEWGDLPKEDGGFREYYGGYETDFDNKCFKVDVAYLQDGVWQPQEKATRTEATLFASRPGEQRLAENIRLTMDNFRSFKPMTGAFAEEAFRFGLKSKNGFLKYSLVQPPQAFGHKAYPPLLTKILSENARKKKAKTLPNPPYTPLINNLSMDYQAVGVIRLGQAPSDGDRLFGEKVFHLRPLGTTEVYPADNEKINFLFPQIGRHEGNLFIGLSGRQIGGPVTLLFHLNGDSTLPEDGPPRIHWAYLSSDIWKPLEKSRVIADTTNGFLASGIVTLDIPFDIDRESSIMPAGQYWLKASADRDLTAFAGLYSITAQALKVTRQIDQNYQTDLSKKLPAGAIVKSVYPLKGIKSFFQQGPSFGGRSPETKTELKTRVSERLRHKNRAVSPWDYERLILEHFPNIFKVKCFSHLSSKDAEASRPGQVLIAVIPYRKEEELRDNISPMVNAVELDEIREFIGNLVSPFVAVEVRNPVYEQIQVRCTVKFARGADSGFYIGKLNQAIVDYLSPWVDYGYAARFGWRIRQVDVESYLRDLDYVDFVTDFSMLHIIEDDRREFTLEDTVRVKEEAKEQAPDPPEEALKSPIFLKEIGPRYPWSIAVPVSNHFIRTMDEASEIIPEITGIDELEIGNTFIISG